MRVRQAGERESFTRFLNVLSGRIFDLINSADNVEKQGGIQAVDQLIDVRVKENDHKIIRFANYLRGVFTSPQADAQTILMASRALGHLAREGGPMTADFVEFELQTALEWLEGGDRYEARRNAAVLILHELAKAAPTLFYQHVTRFLRCIWVALTDSHVSIRESGVKALAACLWLIAQRQSSRQSEWFKTVWERAVTALRNSRSKDEVVHGSLLAVGELLRRRHTGDFMDQRFSKKSDGEEGVCDFVIKYKDSRDKLVRRTVNKLLSRIAAFNPNEFVKHYLHVTLTHLINAMKRDSDRATAFVAVGSIVKCIRVHIKEESAKFRPQLTSIVALAREALSPRRKSRPFCAEALQCVAELAYALGAGLMKDFFHEGLLDDMFNAGLRDRRLVEALTQVADAIPALLIPIQEKLLREISIILVGVPYVPPGAHDVFGDPSLDAAGAGGAGGAAPAGTGTTSAAAAAAVAETSQWWTRSLLASALSGGPDRPTERPASDTQKVKLAMETLGTFDFRGQQLLPFVRSTVMRYLDDESSAIRLEAAKTCSALLTMPLSEAEIAAGSTRIGGPDAPLGIEGGGAASGAGLSDSVPGLRGHGPTVALVAEVLERLLMVGISDADHNIRRTVLLSLDPRFDPFLAQAENLRSLFIALHDEVFAAREAAIEVIGRLTHINPAYVMPALRKTLIQLLTELEFSSEDRAKEEAAQLLGHLIKAAKGLVAPYVQPILKALLPKLRDGGGQSGVASSVLNTLGELSVVGADQMVPYLPELLPLIIDTLRRQGSDARQLVAVRTLGLLASNTGYVVRPYVEHRELLNILLGTLASTGAGDTASWPLRREVMRTIGILGALDPYRNKQNLAKETLHAHAGRLVGPDDAAAVRRASSRSAAGGAGGSAGGSLRTGSAGAAGAASARGATSFGESRPFGTLNSLATGAEGTSLVETGAAVPGAPGLPGVGAATILPSMVASREDYFPTVAVSALMRVLADMSLSIHHNSVIKAVMWIFRSLGLKCTTFLPQVVPAFLDVLRRGDTVLRESVLRELGNLVVLVRQHIRPHLDDLFRILRAFWPASLEHVLRLVENIASALQDEFKLYLADLIPQMLNVLRTERGSVRRNTVVVLHTLVVLGKLLEDYLYLIVPALVRLIEDATVDESVSLAAIDALGRLCRCLYLAEYASRIVHPLSRLLNGSAGSDLKMAALDALCFVVRQMRGDYVVFVPMIRKIMLAHRIVHEPYQRLVQLVLTDRALPADPLGDDTFGPGTGLSRSGSEGGTGADAGSGMRMMHVNQAKLEVAWSVGQRSTADDWNEWMRRLSVELLRESPSPALRACCSLAQVHPSLARELFNAAFVSCWSELSDGNQDALVAALDSAFNHDAVPVEIIQMLLNLAEFMEHDEQPLPIDIKTLSKKASKCHAYAKALYYKEMEFHTNPAVCVESLISINNHLEHPEAAVGILTYAQQHLGANAVQSRETWFEKLNRWEDALEAYERRQIGTHQKMSEVMRSWQDADRSLDDEAASALIAEFESLEEQFVEVALGRMRCLQALGEWKPLLHLVRDLEPRMHHTRRRDGAARTKMKEARSQCAHFGARAAWALGSWQEMQTYVEVLRRSEDQSVSGLFFRSVLLVHQEKFDRAEKMIERTRRALAVDLSALVSESYNRAYHQIVVAQQLSEMEEIVQYMRLRGAGAFEAAHTYITHLQKMWEKRLRGCQRNVDVWSRILGVRSLVVPPSHDMGSWIKFASLCRKAGRISMSFKTLVELGIDASTHGGFHGQAVSLSALLADETAPSHEAIGAALGVTDTPAATPPDGVRSESPDTAGASLVHPRVVFAYLKHLFTVGEQSVAISRLQTLVDVLDAGAGADIAEDAPLVVVAAARTRRFRDDSALRVRCHLRLGDWLRASVDQDAGNEETVKRVKAAYRMATQLDDSHPRAWHSWAVMNFQVVEHYAKTARADPRADELLGQHLSPAVEGFFRSISLGRSRGAGLVLQDLLRLLTLWFVHGARPEMHAALKAGLHTITVDTWLKVTPQLIARIHMQAPQIQSLLHELLARVGRHHPQALIYPLTVASKSTFEPRRIAALKLMDQLRGHSPQLVQQAETVSHELIRVAILWNEQWHKGLEEASRQYFGDHDVDAMLATLLPLHDMLAEARTMREVSFLHTYGRDLADARDWLRSYMLTKKQSHLSQAWDIYYKIFRKISAKLPQLTVLELQFVSPELLAARDLELAVPGTYKAGTEVVRIRGFTPDVQVITSKQRPRKIVMHGSDGREYTFLLKGHEDLRQDERVMQLFGLVNTLLSNNPETAKRDLSIRRYAVTPLSHNAGVVGWVPNCDTLHALIKDFREVRKVRLNVEHYLMCQMAPMYDRLTVIQKVEVFQHALESTQGQDLNKVLWLKSESAEVWLDRRTNYTRSLAVMSMVGYILGLGDRHPSNLMLDRYSGKICHIDFGDCFEVAMTRDKYPEKIPFRLTRMLINAMEVSGIEGTFRSTSQDVMGVLRDNRDSVMAMLEAFVHDPLINWRLLAPPKVEHSATGAESSGTGGAGTPGGAGETKDADGDAADGEEGEHGSANPIMAEPESQLSSSMHDYRGDMERKMLLALGPEGSDAPAEQLNERAIDVITRINKKLTGRDFEGETLDVPRQVDRLIRDATSIENLCQCYIGWCPFVSRVLHASLHRRTSLTPPSMLSRSGSHNPVGRRATRGPCRQRGVYPPRAAPFEQGEDSHAAYHPLHLRARCSRSCGGATLPAGCCPTAPVHGMLATHVHPTNGMHSAHAHAHCPFAPCSEPSKLLHLDNTRPGCGAQVPAYGGRIAATRI